jgi:hypothetical protein
MVRRQIESERQTTYKALSSEADLTICILSPSILRSDLCSHSVTLQFIMKLDRIDRMYKDKKIEILLILSILSNK